MQMPGLPGKGLSIRPQPLNQVLASLWVFPVPGTVPLCGMSLVTVFNFFIDEHLGQACQFQTTLQSAQISKFSTAGSSNAISVLKTYYIP